MMPSDRELHEMFTFLDRDRRYTLREAIRQVENGGPLPPMTVCQAPAEALTLDSLRRAFELFCEAAPMALQVFEHLTENRTADEVRRREQEMSLYRFGRAFDWGPGCGDVIRVERLNPFPAIQPLPPTETVYAETVYAHRSIEGHRHQVQCYINCHGQVMAHPDGKRYGIRPYSRLRLGLSMACVKTCDETPNWDTKAMAKGKRWPRELRR